MALLFTVAHRFSGAISRAEALRYVLKNGNSYTIKFFNF